MQTGRRLLALSLAIYMASFFYGCGAQPADSNAKRQTVTSVLMPEATGEVVYGNNQSSIDASNAGNGYLQVTYNGSALQAKVQITMPDTTVYTYTLTPGQ